VYQRRYESRRSSKPERHLKKKNKIWQNDFQCGGWNSYTLQCGTIVTLISPGDSTLQCGMWLWDDMPLNSPKRPLYLNSTSGFDFDHITALDMSFCTSLRNFIQILGRKNDVMSIFKMADFSYLKF